MATNTKTKKVSSEVSEQEIMQQRIKDLESLVEKMLKNQSQPIETKEVIKVKDEIPFKEFIRVMSMCNNKLALSTEKHGNGIVYHFTEFGEIQSILYDDLQKIIHNNKRFTQDGHFYVLDERVIKLHSLQKYYDKFINEDKIKGILNMSVDEIKELFNTTTKHIQKTIVSMIISEMVAGENMIDLNKVQAISDIYGEDILEIVKTLKQQNK